MAPVRQVQYHGHYTSTLACPPLPVVNTLRVRVRVSNREQWRCSVNSNSRRRCCCYYCCCRCAICVLQWTIVQRIPPPPRLPRVEAAAATVEKPPCLPPYLSSNAAHDFPTTPAGKITAVVVSRICAQRNMTSARGFSAVTVDDALKLQMALFRLFSSMSNRIRLLGCDSGHHYPPPQIKKIKFTEYFDCILFAQRHNIIVIPKIVAWNCGREVTPTNFWQCSHLDLVLRLIRSYYYYKRWICLQ